MADKTPTYHVEISQMLFIAGEATEPSTETTALIERIVKQQVIETFTRASALATRRGTRYISNEDIIFVVRHDKAKVSRLRTFLAWKDVRKNLKDDDEKGGAGGDPTADPTSGEPSAVDDVALKKTKKKSVLPWDFSSFFSVQPPDRDDDERNNESEDEMNEESRRRLKQNDERTLNMTREQYAVWAECRQASFTWRKTKRFKEWCGLADVHEGGKVGDDVIDILGFLTAEIVQRLGEAARSVKNEEDSMRSKTSVADGKKEALKACSLFAPSEDKQSPIQVRHVQEAFRRLQAASLRTRAFENLGPKGVLPRTKLKLI